MFDFNNDESKAALTMLARGLQGMIASGQEAEAKRIYLEKQAQFGFTDAMFAPFTANMGAAPENGYSAQQVASWKANPNTSPVTPSPPPYTPPVLTPHTYPVIAPYTPQTATNTTNTPTTNTTNTPVTNSVTTPVANGPVTAGPLTTSGANSPGASGNQNVTGNLGSGQFGNNNVTGSYNTSNANTYSTANNNNYNTDSHNQYNGWGTQGHADAPGFNTPVLNALYQAQQQRMQAPAPSFNFQRQATGYKKGGRVLGALSRAVGVK